MTPYNFKVAGGTTRTTVSGGSISTSFTLCESATFSLKASSVNGNRKDPNPFSFLKTKVGTITGSAGMSGSGWSVTDTGNRVMGSDAVSPANSCYASAVDPYNKALDKLYGKLRSQTDLSIDLYQIRQTAKLVRDIGSVLINPTRAFARAAESFIRKNKIRRGTKLVGNKWLEFQYGVKPTMETIHSLTTDMVGSLVNSGGFFHVKARASAKAEDSRILTSAGNYWSSVLPVRVDSTDSRRCELSLNYTIGSAERNALSQLTSLNPVSFIYENIPFSFVLDWAWDLGGYLRMLETATMTGLQFQSGYKTVTRRRTSKVVLLGPKSQYGTRYWANASGDCDERSLTRTLLTSLPLPIAPTVNLKMGAERLLSAASLLSQLLDEPERLRPKPAKR